MRDLEVAQQGLHGHEDVDAVLVRRAMPGYGDQVSGQLVREREVAADRLSDVLPEDAVDQRVADVVGDRAVVFVSRVERREVIEPFVEHGLGHILDPLGRDRDQIGVHADHRPGAQGVRFAEGVGKVPALTRRVLRRGDVDLRHLGFGAQEDIFGAVGRGVVGVDDHGLAVGEVLFQTLGGDTRGMGDAIGLLVGRDHYDQLGLADTAGVHFSFEHGPVLENGVKAVRKWKLPMIACATALYNGSLRGKSRLENGGPANPQAAILSAR